LGCLSWFFWSKILTIEINPKQADKIGVHLGRKFFFYPNNNVNKVALCSNLAKCGQFFFTQSVVPSQSALTD
jgi:hypothetical protein